MKPEAVNLVLGMLAEFDRTGGRVAVSRKQQEVQGWSCGRDGWRGQFHFPSLRLLIEDMNMIPYGGLC